MTFEMLSARRLLTGTAAIALTLGLAAPAHAQVDDDLTESDAIAPGEAVELVGADEIIVTGIRAGIAESLDLKRESSSIIDAITAEDIGKLPDVSITDSLARLPGIAAQRVRGRAQRISIRGLGPDFSIALLNGREIVSAGDDRGIEFDVFPSELINQGVVYKSPDARLVATGVAGAVDLRTLRPLDFSGDQANLSARYVVNDNGSLNPDIGADGYRLFGNYVTQNDDETVGFSVGITHQSNPTQILSRDLKTQGVGLVNDGQTAYPLDNPRTGVESRDFQRTSIAGALEFEPSSNFRGMIDGFYSDFEDEGIFRGVETPLATAWTGANPPQLASFTGTGPFVESATYEQAPVILRTDEQGQSSELFAIGANFEFSPFGNGLGIMVDGSISRLDRNDIDYESYAGLANSVLYSDNNQNPAFRDTFVFTTPASGEYTLQTGRDYTDPGTVVLTDPGGWGQVGFIKEPNITDDLNQIRAEANYDMDGTVPFISNLAAGAIYTDRRKSFNSNENFLRAGPAFGADNELTIPDQFIVGATDAADELGFDVIAYDTASLIERGTYTLDAAGSRAFEVEEEIWTLYALAEFASSDDRLRGNIGVQYVDTDQQSTGAISSGVGGVVVGENIEGDSYSDWLPSLNVSYDVTEQVVLRGAAGKAISRAGINDLAANLNVGFDNNFCLDTDGDRIPDTVSGITDPNRTCLDYGGGNPGLRPFESTYVDLSAEWYFSPAGAISVAGFHKSVDDYVEGISLIFPNEAAANDTLGVGFLNTVPTPTELLGDFYTSNPEIQPFRVSSPGNVGEADITGVEIALQLPFSDFTDMPYLSNFGFNGNYTYVDAEVDILDTITTDIPGYSQDTANGELYYEQGGFSARGNVNYRSEYQAEIQTFGGFNTNVLSPSQTTFSAQVGYTFEEGALGGLTLRVEGYNLTDEEFTTTEDFDGVDGPFPGFVRRHELYGRTFNFTVAKKFF